MIKNPNYVCIICNQLILSVWAKHMVIMLEIWRLLWYMLSFQNQHTHVLAAALIGRIYELSKLLFCCFLFHCVTTTCKGKRLVLTLKCSYWMCKHLSEKLYLEQTSLSKHDVLAYKYERLRPERLVLICLDTVYIWGRWKWEYTEDCEKALESTVFYCESGYMPVFHEMGSSCLLNSHIHIQLISVLYTPIPISTWFISQ